MLSCAVLAHHIPPNAPAHSSNPKLRSRSAKLAKSAMQHFQRLTHSSQFTKSPKRFRINTLRTLCEKTSGGRGSSALSKRRYLFVASSPVHAHKKTRFFLFNNLHTFCQSKFLASLAFCYNCARFAKNTWGRGIASRLPFVPPYIITSRFPRQLKSAGAAAPRTLAHPPDSSASALRRAPPRSAGSAPVQSPSRPAWS